MVNFLTCSGMKTASSIDDHHPFCNDVEDDHEDEHDDHDDHEDEHDDHDDHADEGSSSINMLF